MADAIHVNFTDDEASSEALSFETIPTGEYLVALTKIETRYVKDTKPDGSKNKNAGKPFYNIEHTVQEGKYENRKLYGSVMLFDGAAYTLAQLMKALGLTPGQDPVPSAEQLEGKQVRITALKSKNEYKMKKEGTNEPIYTTDVKGYKPTGGGFIKSSGAGSAVTNQAPSGAPLP